ncbi:transcriptional regulator [Candidatus Magnetomorum sp. HK-1]|nr:transcriptional regulator [Candidatus Magnetomorum sp. HK-1]
MKNSDKIELFYSYSHKDEKLRNELEKHLSILRRQGHISEWYDRKISAGNEWEGEIDQHLRSANIILLLVSSDFLYSDYCYGKEMEIALERHEKREALVIPIIIRPVDWTGEKFGKLQALPKNAKPVVIWDNQDEAFTNIVQGIRTAISKIKKNDRISTKNHQGNFNDRISRLDSETSIVRSSKKFDEKTPWASFDNLDRGLIEELLPKIAEKKILDDNELYKELEERSYLKRNTNSKSYQATALGILMFGKNPTKFFGQCRIIAEYYKGETSQGKSDEYENIEEPVPVAIDSVYRFIDKHTRSIFRIVDLNRIQILEYPKKAVREAIVNALVHRDYKRGEFVIVRVFKDDRLEILSPGKPPEPVTIERLKHKKKYESTCRNPELANSLYRLKLSEVRGKGILIMREEMVNHGLAEPEFDLIDGDRFQVTLKSPGENLDKVKDTMGRKVWIIEDFIKDKLTDRQREIISHVQKNGTVTSKWCQDSFGISRDTASKDFNSLIEYKILIKIGKGRATRYELYSET